MKMLYPQTFLLEILIEFPKPHKILESKFLTKLIRAFSSTIAKFLVFTISKHYFFNFKISFYNIPNIKTSIFFTTSFKYYFLIIFYSFFVFIFFILSLPLGLIISTQQSYPLPPTSHHNSNNHQNDQRPTPIKSMTHVDETNQVDDPRRSTRRSTPVTSMIHKPKPMNLDP